MKSDVNSARESVPERFVPGEAPGQLVEAEHYARYWWATGLAAGRRVLDAGCGAGYGTNMLSAGGATEAIGVDIAQDAVDTAATTAAERVSFKRADLHDLPFEDARFDLVVCFEVIEHVEGQDEVIAELARVLAPDGVLAISSPNRGVYPPGNPHHIHEYVPEELRAALGAHFEHVELRRQHDWVAAAILDDATVAADGMDEIAGLRSAKVLGAGPDSEPYTIALAGRRALPDPAPTAVLTGMLEPGAWLHELSEVREELGAARQRLELLELLPALERRNARLEQDAIEYAAIHDQLRADVATLMAELDQARDALRTMHESVSWRATRPLRAIRRLRS